MGSVIKFFYQLKPFEFNDSHLADETQPSPGNRATGPFRPGTREEGMNVLNIDHIGIAVKNLGPAEKFYTEILGLPVQEHELVKNQKVKVAFLPVAGSEVELLESTDPEGPVSRYIDAKGEGIQHLAFRVENIDEALEELKEKGVRLIDRQPRPGAGGARIAFIHPSETCGVLIELCERG
jgi:methylmalonyl-CoA/ethylmalonyl-CoA epimerase